MQRCIRTVAFSVLVVTGFLARPITAHTIFEGCYEAPVRIESGKLNISSLKDLLLLGDAGRSPRYVAIRHLGSPGNYEFIFFDSLESGESYQIARARNRIVVDDGKLDFWVASHASGEGVSRNDNAHIVLVSTDNGDLDAEVQITIRTRSLLVFSKREQTRLSFSLRKIGDMKLGSLERKFRSKDLPGPGSR